jgi:hypothetical protein
MDDSTFDQTAAETFLAEPLIGTFAVAAPEGPPAAVPAWYAYTPRGEVQVITEASSRKARLLADTSCATLVVDAVEPRVRFVSVDLEVVDTRPATAGDRRALASRYLPEGALEGYLAFAEAQLLDEVIVTLRPTRWRYADLTP